MSKLTKLRLLFSWQSVDTHFSLTVLQHVVKLNISKNITMQIHCSKPGDKDGGRLDRVFFVLKSAIAHLMLSFCMIQNMVPIGMV
jgi:hypothetical protein